MRAQLTAIQAQLGPQGEIQQRLGVGEARLDEMFHVLNGTYQRANETGNLTAKVGIPSDCSQSLTPS